MPSSKQQCATTTGCWKIDYQKLSTTKVWEATICQCRIKRRALTQPCNPIFPSAMLVRLRVSTVVNLSKIMAGPSPSRLILYPHNLPLNLSMRPMTSVHHYPVPLSINISHSSNGRTAGQLQQYRTSTRRSKTTLPVKPLPPK